VIVQTESGGATIAAVPVTANESVIGVVRASRPAGLAAESAGIWLALLAIAALIVAGAALLARRTAGQLAAPVERLALVARGLGQGRLTVDPDVSGIEEVDAAHAALVGAGKRIADLLRREQRIASDASHQLRTPLAGLRAEFELALADLGADHAAVLKRALVQIDRMDATIDGLIALARDPAAATGSCDPIAVAEDRVRHWRSEFRDDPRRLDLGVEGDVPPVAVPRFAVATVLDVLLENACRHGTGDIEVVVRPNGAVVAVDVVNVGPYRGPDDPFLDGASGSGGSGLGLGLARRTMERFGGRLLLAETASRTRFGLLLPTRRASSATPHGDGAALEQGQ
jgi:signal transduction histidine kinase